jgi:GT2 family glycosyltransferase
MIPDGRQDAGAPALSIVIVNTDGLDDTLGCLASIFRYPPDVAFEVILVDNCSQDSCLSIASGRFPQVRTFSAPERQGFAKNYNLGMRQCRGEYVLILNNDMVVHEGALSALVACKRDNPDYDMLGGKLLSRDGRIQPECVRTLPTVLTFVMMQLVLDPALPIGRVWRRYLCWRLARRTTGPVPCIMGACMLLNREALETLGPLDEGYQIYYEDIEWCHRVWHQGGVVAYVAEAPITHYGDQTLSRMRVWAMKGAYESALKYFREYRGLTATQTWFLWSGTALSYRLRAFAFDFLEKWLGKPGHAEAYRELSRWIAGQRPDRVFRNREKM